MQGIAAFGPEPRTSWRERGEGAPNRREDHRRSKADQYRPPPVPPDGTPGQRVARVRGNDAATSPALGAWPVFLLSLATHRAP
jgi:hypothetical protein